MDLGRVRAYGKSGTRKAWITNPSRAMLWRLAVPYFEGIAAEIHQRIGRLEEKLGLETEADAIGPGRDATSKQIAGIAARLSGFGKDINAISHRLASLEEEAADASDARSALAGQAAAAAAMAREVAEAVSSLREKIDASRVDALGRGASLRAGQPVPLGHDDLVLAPYTACTFFLVHQHDLIGHQVADGREWEPHVRAAIERAARLEGVAVDAGAYIGLHTVTMSRCFRRVHAFEPQRGIYHLMCGNLALNCCMNVTAHNLALYDCAGPMRLSPSERQEVWGKDGVRQDPLPMLDGQPDYGRLANAGSLTFEPVGNEAAEVQAVALDDLALDGVALIKIDTQGADLRVLRGAAETIRRCRPTVLFEWERDLAAQHGATLDQCHAFFAELDYEVTLLHETSPERQLDYLAKPR